jgi:carbonic anhydrase
MPINEQYLALDGAISAEFQKGLTPEDAFYLLQSGHDRFLQHITHRRSRGNLLADAAEGQFPYAAILGCIDSRVPVEEVFDAAFGDMFVVRLAGNTVNPDVLGSLEYACKYAGSKLILVLGHTLCGAVRGAWMGLRDGNISGLLDRIEPAVEAIRKEEGPEPTDEHINHCVSLNVRHVCARIREESEILREMEDKQEIAIVGAVYDVASGRVDFTVVPHSHQATSSLESGKR